jgi:hypothetical protein
VLIAHGREPVLPVDPRLVVPGADEVMVTSNRDI